jgi:nucleoside 2-deoxyribosyltransferase
MRVNSSVNRTTKGHRLKVYLAGPDVFFPTARQIGSEKKRICAEHGFEGIFPLDNEITAKVLSKSETANAIFQANCDAMDVSDLMIANMMPFRGVSMDVGTAFEIGYMYAQDKPIFGYGTDNLKYLDRVLKAGLGRSGHASHDERGMRIEDFDLADNLMLVCAVRSHGLDIVPGKNTSTDLSAFRDCVQLAAERLQQLGMRG